MLDRSVLKRPGEWLRAIRRGKIFVFLSSLSLFGLFPIPFSPSGHSVVALTTLETPVFRCAGAKVRHVIGTAAGVFLPRDAPFSSLAALPAVFSRTDSIILDGYADIRSPQLPPQLRTSKGGAASTRLRFKRTVLNSVNPTGRNSSRVTCKKMKRTKMTKRSRGFVCCGAERVLSMTAASQG